MTKLRKCILCVLAIIMATANVIAAHATPLPQSHANHPSLHETFAPHFLFGNIYSSTSRMDRGYTRDIFTHHFNAVTAENWHKPYNIAPRGYDKPEAHDFNFERADSIVNWAIENDLTLIGHTLVWHAQSPRWMAYSGPDTPLTRAEARANMEFYIRTLAEHFTKMGTIGAFYSWDVVNEVILSGGGTWTGDWRTQLRTDSMWYKAYSYGYSQALGEHPSDFVYDAFVFARRYFPNAILFYNDYNEEIPAKREAIAQMVEQLNERWVFDMENNPQAVYHGYRGRYGYDACLYNGRLLIEGIGLQGHYHLDQHATNLSNVRRTLERFVETGARLAITELDITVGTRTNRQPSPLPPAQQIRQANAYARVMGYVMEFADYIERVSIWGKADNQSWRAWGQPVIFDYAMNPKPAFYSILEVAEKNKNPRTYTPTLNEETLPEGKLYSPFNHGLTANCKMLTPMRWSVVEGALPRGMQLFSTTGVIGGTPLEHGEFEFVVRVKNYSGYVEERFVFNVK